MLDHTLRIKGAFAHYLHNETLAQFVGVRALVQLVLCVTTREKIQEALSKGDFHLNSIPLAQWDKMDSATRSTVAQRQRERFSWSLFDTVCLLKHVAKYHLADSPLYAIGYNSSAPRSEKRELWETDFIICEIEKPQARQIASVNEANQVKLLDSLAVEDIKIVNN